MGRSIAIGAQSNIGAGATSSIALGYAAAATARNQMVIGAAGDSISNVFILSVYYYRISISYFFLICKNLCNNQLKRRFEIRQAI